MLNESTEEITRSMSNLSVDKPNTEATQPELEPEELTKRLSTLSVSGRETITRVNLDLSKVTPQHPSWRHDQQLLHQISINPQIRTQTEINGIKLIDLLPEDEGYKLVDSLFRKSQQTETDSLSKVRLSDFKIKKVKLIDNPQFVDLFVNGAFAQSQRRDDIAREVFTFTIDEKEHNAGVRKKVRKIFEKQTEEYSTDKCSFLPVWHGTKSEVLDKILKTGFANLAKTDVGYYGKGIYGSTNVEYVKRVYSGGYNQGVLLLNWVAINEIYPVVGIKDIDLLIELLEMVLMKKASSFN